MKTKLLVIGLDGLDLGDLESGALVWMPRLAELARRGRPFALETPIPNNSICCWQTWFCGTDPSVHGMVDFVLPDPANGLYRLTSSADRCAPTLWETAGRRALRSVVFNVPGTYPATTLEGVMVAGAPVVSRQGLTFPSDAPELPPGLLSEYRSDLEFDVPSAGDRDDESDALDMVSILRQHLRWSGHLLGASWDVAILVQTMTDRLLHHYRPRMDPTHPEDATARVVRASLAELDESVAAWIATWRERASVALVSDHGFVPGRYCFHWADWLVERGWMRRGAGGAPSGFFDVAGADRASSRLIPAPASSTGLRFGPSVADASARSRLGQEVADALGALRDPHGRPVVTRVRRREGVYRGSALDRLPDLLVEPADGIALSSRPSASLFAPAPLAGVHSRRAWCLPLDEGLPNAGWATLTEAALHLGERG